jgi:hypothetical protein
LCFKGHHQTITCDAPYKEERNLIVTLFCSKNIDTFYTSHVRPRHQAKSSYQLPHSSVNSLLYLYFIHIYCDKSMEIKPIKRHKKRFLINWLAQQKPRQNIIMISKEIFSIPTAKAKTSL